MSRKKPLKRLSTEDKIVLWGHMDDVIRQISNKKIFTYWKRNGIPKNNLGGYFRYRNKKHMVNITYNDITTNRFWWTELFDVCDFNKIWICFNHCIAMSLDDDVEEYINCLDAINKKIKEG